MLLFSITATAVLVILAIASATLNFLHREAKSQAAAATQNLARSVDQSVESMIDTINFALLVSVDEIGRQVASGRPDRQSITHFLARQQEHNPRLDLLRATNAQGEAIYGAGVITPPASNAERDYFLRLREDADAGLVFSKPIIGKISQKWIWLMARRIGKPDGSFGGVVYASMFIEELEKLLAQVEMQSGSAIALRDGELALVARRTFNTANSLLPGDRRLSTPFQAALQVSRQEGTYDSDSTTGDGGSRTYSYRRNAKYGFTVLVGIPVDVALAEWRQEATIIVGLATVLILLSLAYARLISRAWQRREHYTANLEQADSALRESNATLERRITERSGELQKSELRYRALFESTTDAILIIGRDGVIDCNPAAIMLYGAGRRQNLLGRHPGELSPDRQASGEDSLLAAGRLVQQAITEGSVGFQWIHRRLDGGDDFVARVELSRMEWDGHVVIQASVRDITESSRAEQALQKSEHLLRDSQDAANIGSYINDISRGVWEGTPVLDRIFGITADYPHTNEGWVNFLHPDFARPIRDGLLAAIRDRTLFDAEYKIIRPSDGAERWVRGLGRIAYNNQGTAVSLIGTVQDITEHKTAELEIERERRRFETILRTASDGIHVLDSNGTLIEANDTFLNRLGYDGTAVGRLHVSEWDVQFNAQALRQRLESLLATHHPTIFETRHRCRDGRILDVEISACTIDIEGALAVYCAARDITERRQFEAKIHQLSMAVEQTPNSIVITNLAAEIEYVNEAFVATTGYSVEEVVGKNPRILQSGKTASSTHADMWNALMQGRPWKGELTNVRKDGSEYVEFAIIMPLRQADGSVSHYVAFKEDITEKKLIGDELDRHRHHLEELVGERTRELALARQQAVAASRAKSTFLANMSHEIRTPMNGILGMAHLLRRAGVTPKQAERLDTIDASGKLLLGIINDILDLSKIEAGKLVLECIPVTISTLLTNISELLAERARAKNLRFLIEAEMMPLNLRGDPTRLQQCLLNYATNAVKFTEKGTVTLRAICQEETEVDVLVRFEVQDTGIGIPQEAMTRLFGSFEQADNSTTRKYGGTGLGLSITRRLAELMGGRTGAESLPGVGSTFWCTVRLSKGPEASGQAERVDDVEGEVRTLLHGSRVLVVDDEPINREVATMLLEDVGVVVDAAGDGVEAVAMAHQHIYAAILMDMQMPHLDGLEATPRIRAIPGYRQTPIIAMTANAFAEDKARCFAAGMDGFLTKPFDPEMLFATLLDVLRGRAA